MSTTLPELPPISTKDSLPYSLIREVSGYPESYVQQYARAYGLAVWKAAMECATKVCDDYEAAMWNAYKRGHGPERASDYCQGQSDGGGDCANAIRSLPDPEGKT